MTESNHRLPDYHELPVTPGAPPHSSWGLWGPEDQFGTLNLLTSQRIVESAQLVKRGAVFPLNWDLELPNPALSNGGKRGKPRHSYVFYGQSREGLEDVIDNFYPQGSSQWDAFSHAGSALGFYNGATIEELTDPVSPKNGIENWARRGIVGRAVLVDFGRWIKETNRDFDYTERTDITVSDVQAVLDFQNCEIREGDILLLRTGWMEFYLSQPQSWRDKLARRVRVPGLESNMKMVEYLWNLHVAAVASDNHAVESFSSREVTLHRYLTAFLGVPLGELWYLDDLADDCAQDGVYYSMLTSAPLNKIGGAGSPPNALAIK